MATVANNFPIASVPGGIHTKVLSFFKVWVLILLFDLHFFIQFFLNNTVDHNINCIATVCNNPNMLIILFYCLLK